MRHYAESAAMACQHDGARGCSFTKHLLFFQFLQYIPKQQFKNSFLLQFAAITIRCILCCFSQYQDSVAFGCNELFHEVISCGYTVNIIPPSMKPKDHIDILF